MGTPSDTKLDKLLAKKEALDAQIRQAKARDLQQRRKEDTRRKILAGAAVITEAAHNSEYRRALMQLLERFLSRPDERELFDLAPLPSSTPDLTLVEKTELGDAETRAA